MADRDEEYRLAKRRAVGEALQLFGKIWQRKFSVAAVQADIELWIEACDTAATQFVVPAAKKLVAGARSGSYPPKPADLCDMARTLERQAVPDVMPRGGDAPAAGAILPHCPKNLAAIDRLGRKAYAQLGTWKLVSEVWALLWVTATSNGEREAVRNGTMPEDLFDLALERVAGGYRVPGSGPLGRVAI